MAPLTTAARKKLPAKSFAGPDRSYPIQDASHARNALARASQFASPAVKAQVRSKVAAKFPAIKVAKGGYEKWEGSAADNRMDAEHEKGGYVKKAARPKHHHALAMAAAKHLMSMGHISPQAHDQIRQQSMALMQNAPGAQNAPAAPDMQQPQQQGAPAPFGSFAPMMGP